MVVLLVVIAGLLAESRSRQRELTDSRREALRVQQQLESAPSTDAYMRARALFDRHPELLEAELVQGHALRTGGEGQYSGISFLEGMVRGDPSRWACRALLAEFWQAVGDSERAHALRDQAEREAPDTADAWYLRSLATLDVQAGLACAEEAVRRDRSHTLAWERLADLRQRTGDLDGALQDADKLIELGEDTQYWTLFKGHVLAKQGRLQHAVREYGQLGANGYLYQAHTYRRMKEYAKAVECYDRVLEQIGEEARAVWHFYQRATPLWILGRREEAVEDYRRVHTLLGRPFYSDARAFLILRELGHQQKAEEVLSAALREVENPSWLRQIFRCLAGQLSPDQLVADGTGRNNLEQLCEAYYYAGEVCLLAGDRDAARRWFERCVQTGVEFDPDTSLETPMNEYELAQWRLDTLSREAP
jgi:tetratricopeptide (TPR) repeat protein